MARQQFPAGWWENGKSFEINLVIDFATFVYATRATRGKKSKNYTVCPVFSWKRARQIITIEGRPSVGLSTPAKLWAKAAAAQLRGQWPFGQPLAKHVLVNAAIVSYLPNARNMDASNLYQGPEDIMQTCRVTAPGKRGGCKDGCNMHAGILMDDSQVESHNRSGRRIDRKRPRVEIILTPAELEESWDV